MLAERRNTTPDRLALDASTDGRPCAECGHRIPQGSANCPRCGAKLPSNLPFGLGVAAAAVFSLILLAVPMWPTPQATIEPGRDDHDVGPGSSFAAEHPTLIPTVTEMIRSHAHRCPVLVSLWNEPDTQNGSRLEALCGPDRNDIDASLHYAVYLRRQVVSTCMPWKEFGPDCR